MNESGRALALAEALDDLAAGRPAADPPAEIAELRELAAAIAPPPAVEVDPAFRLRARAALVEAMHAEPAVTPAAPARFWRAIAGALAPAVAARRSAMPALIVALLLLATSGGVAVASQNAQPGDVLYPVRAQVEVVQGAFVVPVHRLILADQDDATATATVAPTSTVAPTDTVVPTATATAVPTDTPVPTATTAAAVVPLPTAGVPTVIADLRADVAALAQDPDVRGKSYEGLLAKLRAAQAALDRGQPRVAENILGAFDDELNAMHRSGHIDETDYDTLLTKAGALRSGLTTTAATPAATATATGDEDDSGKPHKDKDDDKASDHEGKGPPAERAAVATPIPPAPPAATDDGKEHGNGHAPAAAQPSNPGHTEHDADSGHQGGGNNGNNGNGNNGHAAQPSNGGGGGRGKGR